jgi:hypothetical protein
VIGDLITLAAFGYTLWVLAEMADGYEQEPCMKERMR